MSSRKLELQRIWRDHPVIGVKQLFGIEPTNQQISLIQDAWNRKSRVAVSSAQGAGKTSSLTWLVFLFLLTHDDCRILITSPSYQQLSRVFSSEIAKWHYKMLPEFKDDFVITKERIALRGMEGFQFASMVTASAEHEENLQGGHSKNYIVLADEASGIDEHIFDVLLGTLGTGFGGSFILTSNPLRSSGRFYEIFSRELPGWNRHYFSAYDSPIINKEWIEEMKETYGEDSDTFRVRVLGRFPRSSSTQFFPSDSVETAIHHDISRNIYTHYPLIGSCDVARFGDDQTVFCLRQGPKLHDIKKYSKLSTMETVAKLVDFNQEYHPAVIHVDSIGVGAGVFDRALELGLPVKSVVVSQKSTDPMQYLNLRSQLYGLTRQWLENGADIPNDESLRKQLLSIEYGYNNKMQIQMVSKKDIKAKGLESPDIVDSLVLTFASECFARKALLTKRREIRKTGYLWV